MKPVLVHYVNVGNLDHTEISGYMQQIMQLCTYDGEYHTVFLPVRNQETKIDCLNPVHIKECDGKEKFINKLNYLKHRTKEIVDKLPYTNKNILLVEKI
jgi:hypothetical protein